MAEPDVTVVVLVFNTMPYLTATLDSLVRQTLITRDGGSHRLEVVAVDDGSTDGSGAELDRYAEQHPGLFTVIHEVNSGGPASPCNVGLEHAHGRYVFFLGADDYLGD
jgi:glycosyltransferase involved in cell wall biosynthesis